MFHLSTALSGPQAASQVIWRALGPGEWLRPHAVQDWAGLLPGEIESSTIVAVRYDIARQTLFNWRRIVVRFVDDIWVPVAVRHRLTRPTTPDEGHIARQRQASLFGLRVDGIVRVVERPAPQEGDLGLIRSATRILAALGEVPLQELTAALNRARPSTRPVLLTKHHVAAVLLRSESIVVSLDRARLAVKVPAWPADLGLLDAARRSGRSVHDREQVRALLTAAGYARSVNPTLTYHPLLRQVDRGWWAVRSPGP